MTAPELVRRAREATLHVHSLDELPRERLLACLAKYSFACIRGLVAPDDMRRAVAAFRERFDARLDAATTGESPSDVRRNFQKLAIGCAEHGGVNRPRFMRTLYNPLWEPDIYGLGEAFRMTARVRNLLAGWRTDFAIDREEDGMWTAARIHHFPAGGGFMVAHQDTVLPAMYRAQGLDRFYQLLLLVTQKGEDFESGGGFVEVDGERFLYEDVFGRGDILVYDAQTVHGVADIDVRKPFRQDSPDGRMSALVTLYRTM